MQQDTIAIKVEGLSKTYKLYDRPIDRLKEMCIRDSHSEIHQRHL